MKMIIFIICVFLVVVYLYTFLKIRKNRKNNSINTVDKFHEKYLDRIKKSQDRNNQSGGYQKQITKYNSQIDYIEKK